MKHYIGAVSRTAARLCAAPDVGWHGHAQRGHMQGEPTHARAFALGMAPGLSMTPEEGKDLCRNGTEAVSDQM